MAIEMAIKVGTHHIVVLFAATGASSRLMVASSGFRCSPGHAASGDATCIASMPPHGHGNGQQLLGVIIAKVHVMVH